MYMYTYLCMYVCMYVCRYVCMYVCMCVCMCVCVCARARARVYCMLHTHTHTLHAEHTHTLLGMFVKRSLQRRFEIVWQAWRTRGIWRWSTRACLARESGHSIGCSHEVCCTSWSVVLRQRHAACSQQARQACQAHRAARRWRIRGGRRLLGFQRERQRALRLRG